VAPESFAVAQAEAQDNHLNGRRSAAGIHRTG